MLKASKMGWWRLASVCVMFLGAALVAAPLTVYVDSSVVGAGSGTAVDPYSTIGAAVAAINGNAAVGQNEGTVLIAGGNYSSTLNGGKESFGTDGITITKFMTIKGGYAGGGDWTDSSRVPRTTDIDLTNAGTRAFYQNPPTHLTRISTFDGLTIRNADHSLAGGTISSTSGWAIGMAINDCLFENNTTTANGGAVNLVGQTAPSTIMNSDFIGNSSGAAGGAVRWDPGYNFTHLIEGCTFDGNSAVNGGAVNVNPGSNSGAAAVIRDSTFTGNSASTAGGAIFNVNGEGTPPVAIKESILTGNSAPVGAAVGGSTYWHGEYYLENCLVAGNTGGYAIHANGWRVNNDYALDLAHCTIVDNPGGGIYAYQAYTAGDLGLRVRNSIIASNGASGIYYNANGGEASILEYNDVWDHTTNYLMNAFAGPGSLSVDPLFKGFGDNPYLLKASSPVKDAAIDLGIYLDLLGDARPEGLGFAMGAFEFPIPEPATAMLFVLGGLTLLRRRQRR